MSEQRDNPEVVHEESDVNVRAILGFGAGLLAVGVIIHLLLLVLFSYYTKQAAQVPRAFPLSAEYQQQAPPQPRLQAHPEEDMRQLRAQEDAVLHGYGWVDKSSGVARIPIDEAMKIVVQRGLPARKATR
jgi:hypothetical protein